MDLPKIPSPTSVCHWRRCWGAYLRSHCPKRLRGQRRLTGLPPCPRDGAKEDEQWAPEGTLLPMERLGRRTEGRPYTRKRALAFMAYWLVNVVDSRLPPRLGISLKRCNRLDTV
jgi:hypothetical protein